MSQPGGDDGGVPAPTEPLDALLAGLHDRFAAHRPQGSRVWGFTDAFRRLEEAWGDPEGHGGPLAATEPPPAPAIDPDADRAATKRLADRLFMDRLRAWVDHRATAVATTVGAAVAARVTADGLSGAQEGFRATLEALRFLAARAEALEADAARRRDPVTGTAALEPDDASALLAPAVVAELAGRGLRRPVLHTECGSGGLLAALRDAGVAAHGVDPRGPLVVAAAAAGLAAEIGEATEAVGALDGDEVGALVLGGVVDRLGLEDLGGLLEAALGRLAPGTPLVVVSRGPDAVAGWAAVARDLLPGRPLHAETWALLLARSGCSDVRRLDGGAAAPGAPYALVAGAPGRP